MFLSMEKIVHDCFSAQRGSWGQEERHHLPFQRGVHFYMTITVTHNGFSVSSIERLERNTREDFSSRFT